MAKFNILDHISEEIKEEKKSDFEKKYLVPLTNTNVVLISKQEKRKARLHFIHNDEKLGTLIFSFNGNLLASESLIDWGEKTTNHFESEMEKVLQNKFKQYRISWKCKTGLIAYAYKRKPTTPEDKNPDYEIKFHYNFTTMQWDFTEIYLKEQDDDINNLIRKANKID